MGDVVPLGCITTLDIPVERVLEKAKDVGYQHVLVIGLKEDGELVAQGSSGETGLILLMVEQFKHQLLSGQFDVSPGASPSAG